MTAADVRRHLETLLAERSLAVAAGPGADATYLDDLEADVASSQATYVGLAVTEIATLRAELGGPLQG